MARATQVKNGQVWTARISGRDVQVKVLGLGAPTASGRKQFKLKNLSSGRTVERTAGSLRQLVPEGSPPPAPTATAAPRKKRPVPPAFQKKVKKRKRAKPKPRQPRTAPPPPTFAAATPSGDPWSLPEPPSSWTPPVGAGTADSGLPSLRDSYTAPSPPPVRPPRRSRAKATSNSSTDIRALIRALDDSDYAQHQAKQILRLRGRPFPEVDGAYAQAKAEWHRRSY